MSIRTFFVCIILSQLANISIAHALDFDKEIEKQNSVSNEIMGTLVRDNSSNLAKNGDVDGKDKGFSIALIPKKK